MQTFQEPKPYLTGSSFQWKENPPVNAGERALRLSSTLLRHLRNHTGDSASAGTWRADLTEPRRLTPGRGPVRAQPVGALLTLHQSTHTSEDPVMVVDTGNLPRGRTPYMALGHLCRRETTQSMECGRALPQESAQSASQNSQENWST